MEDALRADGLNDDEILDLVGSACQMPIPLESDGLIRKMYLPRHGWAG